MQISSESILYMKRICLPALANITVLHYPYSTTQIHLLNDATFMAFTPARPPKRKASSSSANLCAYM